jgi:hypothetical protein
MADDSQFECPPARRSDRTAVKLLIVSLAIAPCTA